MNEFERQITQYYTEQSLSEQTVDAMLSKACIVRPSFVIRQWLALAAAASLIVIGILCGWLWFQRQHLTERVVAEMVAHHQHGPTVELPLAHENVLSIGFSQEASPIPPIDPRVLKDFDLRGVGYSALQGQLATQLSVQERASGKRFTLYVTPLTPEFKDIHPGIIERQGMTVKLWKEQEQLFGLTGEMATPAIHRTVPTHQ